MRQREIDEFLVVRVTANQMGFGRHVHPLHLTISKTLQAHYAHLLVHSALHARGWDHETSEEDAQVMELREIEILARLGFDNPY